jgi:hypothetical protein
LSKAAGLAAKIDEIFGIRSRLVEGHNGIYQVTINGQVAVTNQGKCSLSATEDEILSEIAKFINPLPDKKEMIKKPFPIIRRMT